MPKANLEERSIRPASFFSRSAVAPGAEGRRLQKFAPCARRWQMPCPHSSPFSRPFAPIRPALRRKRSSSCPSSGKQWQKRQRGEGGEGSRKRERRALVLQIWLALSPLDQRVQKSSCRHAPLAPSLSLANSSRRLARGRRREALRGRQRITRGLEAPAAERRTREAIESQEAKKQRATCSPSLLRLGSLLLSPLPPKKNC